VGVQELRTRSKGKRAGKRGSKRQCMEGRRETRGEMNRGERALQRHGFGKGVRCSALAAEAALDRVAEALAQRLATRRRRLGHVSSCVADRAQNQAGVNEADEARTRRVAGPAPRFVACGAS